MVTVWVPQMVRDQKKFVNHCCSLIGQLKHREKKLLVEMETIVNFARKKDKTNKMIANPSPKYAYCTTVP